MKPSSPSKPLSKYEETISRVINDIADRKLRPNQRIIEKNVAEDLKISRTPVREAFRTLELRGYLTKNSSRGYSVTDHTIEQIQESFESQEAIETMAIRLACTRIDQKTIKQAEKYRDLIKEAIHRRDIVSCMEYNSQLHYLLCKASQNKTLLRFYEILMDKPFTKRVLRLFTNSELNKWADEHDKLLEAVSKGNQNIAEKVVRRHYKTVFRVVSERTL